MALVAVHAVVHVSLHALMVSVGLRFRVAIRALENRVVIGIGMAGRTHSIRAAMVDRKLCVLRVIKRRVLPVRRAVAVLAGRREELRLRRVSRIRRTVVVSQVTTNARRRQRLIVAVDMAVDARSRWHGVRPGQRELRFVVIERRIRPGDRVMAQLTGGTPGIFDS